MALRKDIATFSAKALLCSGGRQLAFSANGKTSKSATAIVDLFHDSAIQRTSD